MTYKYEDEEIRGGGRIFMIFRKIYVQSQRNSTLQRRRAVSDERPRFKGQAPGVQVASPKGLCPRNLPFFLSLLSEGLLERKTPLTETMVPFE